MTFFHRPSRRTLVILTIVLTVVATVIALNFSSGEKKIEQKLPHLFSVDDPQFERSMGVLLGPPLVAGNKVTALLNGDQIFPSMLEAIRSAKQSITFETYIYWSGEIGKAFAQALSERAQAGVKVHVLLDWVGSAKIEEHFLDEMRRAGVEVRKYHPLRWYNLARMNNRTHRKLLVVDGKIGFTGGVGIADLWTGHAQDVNHWRDSHFRLEGPAVGQMQATFLDNWMKTTGEVLDGAAYFPKLEPVGDAYAQVFKSSPTEGSESVRLMYLLSISSATRSIQIANAYFVPDDLALQTLIDAMKRGVRVQILLPGTNTDTETVRRASRSRWGPILEAGAEIYEYLPTMYHCKVVVVDGRWVSVGSTNFDNRSFRLNDEANLNIYNEAFAKQQIQVFNDDLKLSKKISLSQWRNRPWTEKLLEHTVGLLRGQL